MDILLAVAGGGALGALLRYGMSNAVHAWAGKDFPYGTLTVNIVGSLFIGFLYVWLYDRFNIAPESGWRAFLIVGLLGGFTTFSAFSIETVNLLQKGEVLKSLVYVSASLTLCIAGAYMGTLAARHLA